MVLVHDGSQPGPHYVRINLCRGYVRVPKHGLQAAKIRAALQQMCREAMTNDMRSEAAEDANLSSIPT